MDYSKCKPDWTLVIERTSSVLHSWVLHCKQMNHKRLKFTFVHLNVHKLTQQLVGTELAFAEWSKKY
ncbi:hypothetical protein C0J52_02081 [Blattella germanica]|nr:hypothetical protein C0J52_02081 [Blattella germanica]